MHEEDYYVFGCRHIPCIVLHTFHHNASTTKIYQICNILLSMSMSCMFLVLRFLHRCIYFAHGEISRCLFTQKQIAWMSRVFPKCFLHVWPVFSCNFGVPSSPNKEEIQVGILQSITCETHNSSTSRAYHSPNSHVHVITIDLRNSS